MTDRWMEEGARFVRFVWDSGTPFWVALAVLVIIFLLLRLGPTALGALGGAAKDVWEWWSSQDPPAEDHSDVGGPAVPPAHWNDLTEREDRHGAGPPEGWRPPDEGGEPIPGAVVTPNTDPEKSGEGGG
jgi:hypothetical protein